ncbi:helix-turn-helix transcriptional regulator [Nocardiopsis rhodophaea]
MRTRLSLSVRGKRLLRELRRHRMEREMSPEEVARRLGWHKTKLYRIERGESRLILDDLEELLELYGVRSPERESLFQLGRDAWKRGWWLAYRDLYQGESFFVMENDAAKIGFYAPNLLPGLLQTEDYARCLIRAAHPDMADDAIQRQVQVRMERQAILTRRKPPRILAVMDEGVLRRTVGGETTYKKQLEHLLELGKRPNVDLHVIPFQAGEHMGQEGQFTLFEFPDPEDPPVAYQEGLFGDVYVEDVADMSRYMLAAEKSLDAALSKAETVAFIERLAKETR